MISSITRIQRRARLLFGARAADAEMDEEMRLHVELEAEELVRTRGLTYAQALREARIAFGGEDRFKELGRDARGTRTVQDALRDFSVAFRTLRRNAGFAIVSTLTIGLGIGAVAAVLALVHAVLIEPLPYDEPDRLVTVSHAAPGIGLAEAGLSSGTYFHYRSRAHSLEAIAVFTEAVVNLSGDDIVAERVELAMAGPELFQVLRVDPLLGRAFTHEDVSQHDMMDYTDVFPVLISEELWRRRYGADPGIVGRIIDINATAREVIAVLPADFDFPAPSTQVWLLSVPPEATANFASRFGYDAVARLRPGVSSEQAQTDLAIVLGSIEGAYPDATAKRIAEVQLRPIVTPLKDAIVGDTRATLWILAGSMALLLVVACSNVSNLALVHAEHRRHDVSLRRALGARTSHLVRLFAFQNVVIAGAGAALGVLLAWTGLRLLVLYAAIDLPRLHELDMDGAVIATVAVLAFCVAGLLTALSLLHSARSPAGTMSRSVRHGPMGDRRTTRTRDLLVAAQMGLALPLLIGSALLVQSYYALARVDPGFDPEGVLTVEMGLPFSRAQQHRAIYEALLERARALPGVTAAAAATDLPLTRHVWTNTLAYPLRISEAGSTSGDERPVAIKFFMPGYFEVMRIPIIEGHSISPNSPAEVTRPVLVSAALASRLFPHASAVGRRVRRLQENGEEIYMRAPDGTRVRQPDYVITGVVGDVRQESLRAGPAEIVYIPVLERRVDPGFIPTEMNLVIRAGIPPLMLAPAVRDVIREIDPVLGVARIRTLTDVVAASTARERFLAVVLVVAASGSLFLGAVGIYGVLAYIVRQRTHEIGIRIALGAHARAVTVMVVRESLGIVLVGTTAGLLLALVATRLLRSTLFGVTPGDPVTIAAMTALLLAVSLVAMLLPAGRATSISPMTAMRAD